MPPTVLARIPDSWALRPVLMATAVPATKCQARSLVVPRALPEVLGLHPHGGGGSFK